MVNSQGLNLNWWDGNIGGRNDGIVDGGNGEWNAGNTEDRWTQADALINAPYQNYAFAVFSGSSGTVEVNNSEGQVGVSGMQFAKDGYVIQGGAVELNSGINSIRVGDGTQDSSAMVATINSNLIGSGQLNKTDLGTLVLTGDNSFSGETKISEGILQLGDGGVTGSVLGKIENNGTLITNHSNEFNIDGMISGTGKLVQEGTGTTTLLSENSYEGGTEINHGVLVGTANSFGTGAITNHTQLVLEQSFDAVMENSLHGEGQVIKNGSGELTYTGSGTLSGPTLVNTGTWNMKGSLAQSEFQISFGATLSGTGTVGTTYLDSGSTVSPGAGGSNIGTLNVNGDFIQKTGSSYVVNVTPQTENSDKINVAGAAVIESGAILNVQRINNNDYALNRRYTVLTSDGGVQGTYVLTGQTEGAFIKITDSYDANNVYLIPSLIRNVDDVDGTHNQNETGGGLVNNPPIPPNTPIAEQPPVISNPIIDKIIVTPSIPEVHKIYDNLSGEVYASTQTALIENSRFVRNAVMEQLNSNSCSDNRWEQKQENGSSCVDKENTQAWIKGFGNWGHINGQFGVQGIDNNTNGVVAGSDRHFGNNWKLGVLAGMSRSQIQAVDRGDNKVKTSFAGLYGEKSWNETSLRFGVDYSWNKMNSKRFINIDDSFVLGSYKARSLQSYVELSHNFFLNHFEIEPFVEIADVTVKNDSLKEWGGNAALQVKVKETSSVFTTVGARLNGSLGEKTNWKVMAGVRHISGDVLPTSQNTFDVGGTNSFTIQGVSLDKNVGILKVGVEILGRPNFLLDFNYNGQFGSRIKDNGFEMGLNYKF